MTDLTVLMAVHNDEKYVETAIHSILGQTFQDFELLVIADNSQDNSIDLIKRIGDPRIRIEYNPTQYGLTRSLNRGLSLARGRFIARMDSDDRAFPERLQRQYDFLIHHPECGLVGTWFREIDEKGLIISEIRPPESNDMIKAALQSGNVFAHSSVMYPRHCIVELNGYREFFEFSQDYDLFLRLAARYDVHIIPEILLDWRFRFDSISVRFKILQGLYAKLAKECFFFDASIPCNKNEWLDRYTGSPSRLRRTSAIGYYQWAGEVFFNWTRYSKRITACSRLLLRSFAADPWCFIKLLSRTIRNAFSRFFHFV